MLDAPEATEDEPTEVSTASGATVVRLMSDVPGGRVSVMFVTCSGGRGGQAGCHGMYSN